MAFELFSRYLPNIEKLKEMPDYNPSSWFNSITEQSHEVRIYENVMEVTALVPVNCPLPRLISKRGKVKNFSDKSRRNLLKLLGRVRFKQLHHLNFVTLTYHNSFPRKSVDAKSHIHDFLQDVRRRWPSITYVWRYEFQKRGAPHFHLITGFLDELSEFDRAAFQQELYDLWSFYLKCGCKHCARISVRVDKITSYRHARAYVCKYITKDAPPPPDDEPGRFWGKSKNLPTSPMLRAYTCPDSFLLLRHICKNILRSGNDRAQHFSDYVAKSWSFFILLDDCDRDEIIAGFTRVYARNLECAET